MRRFKVFCSGFRFSGLFPARDRMRGRDRDRDRFSGLAASCFAVAFAVLYQGACAQSLIESGTTPLGYDYWSGQTVYDGRTAVSFSFVPLITRDDLDAPTRQFLMLDVVIQGDNERMSADEVFENLADLDAEIGYSATFGLARITLVAPSENLVAAAQLLNHVLTKPRFDQSTIERMRRYQHQYSVRTRNSAQGALDDLVADILMDRHPLRPLIRHTVPDGPAALPDRQDLRTFHARTFASDRVYTGVAGTADTDTLERAIDAALSGLKPVPAHHTAVPVPPNTDGMAGVPARIRNKVIMLHKPDAGKTLVATHFALPPKSAQKDVMINLIMSVLGNGPNSRLFQAVRLELRAAYGFSALLDEYTNDIQFLRLVGEVEDTRVPEVLQAVADSVYRFAFFGVTPDELEHAKYRSNLYFEDILSQENLYAEYLSAQQVTGAPLETAASVQAEINGMTPLSLFQQITALTRLGDGDQKLTVVVSPNAAAPEGLEPPACVITRYRDWRNC